jgi:hypothetical protein
MKDIVNRKIERNFGYWELLKIWEREYGYGQGYGSIDGSRYGSGDGYIGYSFGYGDGNGESRIK